MVKVKNMWQAKTWKIRLLNYNILGESSIPVAQLKAGLHPAETPSSISKIPSALFETHQKELPNITDSQPNPALLLVPSAPGSSCPFPQKGGSKLNLTWIRHCRGRPA